MGDNRVIVTGSQDWTDPELVRKVLRAVWIWAPPGTVLVSGGCPRGADRLAETAWRALGGEVETHRPVWRPNGVWDPAAGIRRSEHMVLLGASLCVAFGLPCQRAGCAGKPADPEWPFHVTHGTGHCSLFAARHGIRTGRFTPILAA